MIIFSLPFLIILLISSRSFIRWGVDSLLSPLRYETFTLLLQCWWADFIKYKTQATYCQPVKDIVKNVVMFCAYYIFLIYKCDLQIFVRAFLIIFVENIYSLLKYILKPSHIYIYDDLFHF